MAWADETTSAWLLQCRIAGQQIAGQNGGGYRIMRCRIVVVMLLGNRRIVKCVGESRFPALTSV
jgi:hypothetical protein